MSLSEFVRKLMAAIPHALSVLPLRESPVNSIGDIHKLSGQISDISSFQAI